MIRRMVDEIADFNYLASTTTACSCLQQEELVLSSYTKRNRLKFYALKILLEIGPIKILIVDLGKANMNILYF